MNENMLHDILEIEKRIEADLVAERAAAQKWLEQKKSEIDGDADRMMAGLAETACRTVEDRCQKVRNEGAEKIRSMRRHVRKLRALSDEELRPVIRRRLARILPSEGDDDHPDGQN